MVTTDQSDQWRAFCSGLFLAAIRPVLPSNCLPLHLPDPGTYSAVKLIALGKAAAAMARVVEEAWPDVALSGIAVCRDGYGQTCHRIEVIESAHPVPDERSVVAAERALAVAAGTTETELLLVLLSGGGSSLACLPAEGLGLEEKKRIITELMHAGADIRELNTVRKHMSRIKGGRLAAAARKAGKVVTLAISDVVGDDPSLIASGPTVPDASNRDDAAAILRSYDVRLPETWAPKTDWPADGKASFQIIANASNMLEAAKTYAEQAGFKVVNLGDDLIGEARDVGRNHAAMAQEHLQSAGDTKMLLLSGGELTATVTGAGEGGPNQEYVLSLAAMLTPEAPIYAFAADTDGMDGTGGAAGAMTSPDDRKRAIIAALEPVKFLNENDSHRYFNEIGGSFQVKPTFTNTNDLRVIAIMPKGLALA